LTIYPENLALVKDLRRLELKKGINELSLENVSAQIDPTSVHLATAKAGSAVALLEQTFRYDIVNPATLLQKFVGQEISVAAEGGQLYRGKLLGSVGGDVMLQQSDGGVVVVQQKAVENLRFPSLPTNLVTRPTLRWKLRCEKEGMHELGVNYLTAGLGWHAEYVAVSKKDDTLLELRGWVTIDNRSGSSYQNAAVRLVAGQVHRAVEAPPRLMKAPGIQAMEMAPAPEAPFEERPFFEYHLYTLSQRASFQDNETKQIALFTPAETKVTRLYSYDGARDGKSLRANLEFKNSAAEGLGLPLPKGKVRVYKESTDGTTEFIGEDFIQHTPKDETVRLFVGNAFDVVGERNQTVSQRISDRAREEEYEIKLRNHKDVPIEVTVIEHFWSGDWVIRKANYEWKKKDAQTVEFQVPVPKEGQAALRYSVLLQW